MRFETQTVEDAEFIIVSFGIAARIATAAVGMLRSEGRKIGHFRPITLFPFPEKQLHDLAGGEQEVHDR